MLLANAAVPGTLHVSPGTLQEDGGNAGSTSRPVAHPLFQTPNGVVGVNVNGLLLELPSFASPGMSRVEM